MNEINYIDTDHNALIIPILKILKNATEAISEHELILTLKAELDQFPVAEKSASLALFQTHFLVMNALYQLQHSLLDEGIYLLISPLKIQLLSVSERGSTDLVEPHVEQSLSEYYLDWKNLEDTGEEEVERLLNSFWQYYHADDKQLQAYQVLGLEPGVEWKLVQKTYRQLASAQHPDRGGDASRFMEIREAYEVLLRVEN